MQPSLPPSWEQQQALNQARGSHATVASASAHSNAPTFNSSVHTEPSFNPYAQQQQQPNFQYGQQYVPQQQQPGLEQYGIAPDAPPPIPSAEVVLPPNERRAARHRGVLPSPNASAMQASQQTSFGGGSEQGSPNRMSRATARAVARGSSRDNSSERSSKIVKDITRDERGRRVDRPRQPSKADVHIIGEIAGASGFGNRPVFCRWRLVYDRFKSWAVMRGAELGATQVSSSWDEDSDYSVWDHPLDIHMSTQKLEAWPSLMFMVYGHDDDVKDCFLSYGIAALPNTPGSHTLECRTWYATETQHATARRTFGWFLGMAPRLEDDVADVSFVTDVSKREDASPFVCTVGSGTVHLRLHMMFRNLSSLTRSLPDSLYKSLENFNASVEESRRREVARRAAMQEYKSGGGDGGLTAGQRQMKDGRAARFEAARQALETRRGGASGSRDASQDGDVGASGQGLGDARSRSADPARASRASDAPGGVVQRADSGRGGIRSAPRERPPALNASTDSTLAADPAAAGAAGAAAGATGAQRPPSPGGYSGTGGRDQERPSGGARNAGGGGAGGAADADLDQRRQDRLQRREQRLQDEQRTGTGTRPR